MNMSDVHIANRWNIRRKWRAALLPGLCGFVMVYAGYHAVQGQNGLFAWRSLQLDISEASTLRDALSDRRQELEKRVTLMRQGSANADMADERARRTLGVLASDEIIVRY